MTVHPAPGGDEVGPFGGRAYFLHVKKAAGITMRRVLAAMYPAEAVCPAERYAEWVAMSDPERYQLFCGHFGLRPIERFPDITVLTTMREPVARTLSWYHQLRRFPGQALHETVIVEAPTFAEFVRHPEGQARIHNYQARALVGSPEPHRVLASTDLPHDELAERAIARLDSCAWVGVVERLDDCLVALAYRAGHPAPSHVAAANRSPVPNDVAELDDATRTLVEEMTRVDALVLEHAWRRAEAEVAAATTAWLAERGQVELAAHSRAVTGELVIDLGQPMVTGGFVDRARVEGLGVVRWVDVDTPAWIDIPRWFGPGTRVGIRFVGETPDRSETVDLRIDQECIGGALADEADGTWFEGAVTTLHGPVSRIEVTCSGGRRTLAGVRLRVGP